MFDGAAWVSIVDSALAAGPPVPGTPGSGTGSWRWQRSPGSVIVSPTQPVNPVKGAEWWNGTVLQVWDGTAWHIIGPAARQGLGPASPPSPSA